MINTESEAFLKNNPVYKEDDLESFEPIMNTMENETNK